MSIFFLRCYNKIGGLWPVLSFCIFVGVFFGTLTTRIVFSEHLGSQFPFHVQTAEQMSLKHEVLVPHFIFHLSTIAHHSLVSRFLHSESIASCPEMKSDWGMAAIVVMTETYIAIALLLFISLKKALSEHFKKKSEVLAYVVAFSLCLVQPIYLLAPLDGKYYLGYLTPANIYVIPTQVLLKLPSLALFLLTPLFFSREMSRLHLPVVGLLAILSGLAKPNYIIVMLPSFILLIAVTYIQRGHINWSLVCSVLVATLAVLTWQYYFKFMDQLAPVYKSTIALSLPFEVWAHYSNFVPIKFLLSILFPLYITFVFWDDVKKDLLTRYAWALFVVGLLYTTFLCETGEAKFAGNFVWSGQIANFMLFVSSSMLFFSMAPIHNWRSNKRVLFGIIIFSLHVACGMLYYIRSYFFNYE